MNYMTPVHAQKKPPPWPGDNAPETYVNGRGGTTLEAIFQARSIGCWLEYKGAFRRGSITYVETAGTEPPTRIVFRHQACRARAHRGRFVVQLPPEADWEAATGTALARRDDIIDFVAETVRREEAGSWRYVIEADRIVYY